MDHHIKKFNAPPLEYLSEDHMRDIHSAALEILEDVGTIVHHDTEQARTVPIFWIVLRDNAENSYARMLKTRSGWRIVYRMSTL